MNTIKNTMKT